MPTDGVGLTHLAHGTAGECSALTRRGLPPKSCRSPDNHVTLAMLSHGTADKILGFDGSGVPAELDRLVNDSVGLEHLQHGTANRVVGFDADGVPSELFSSGLVKAFGRYYINAAAASSIGERKGTSDIVFDDPDSLDQARWNFGTWTDGTTIWRIVRGEEILAYNFDGTRDSTKDLSSLDAANTGSRGIWSDGTYFWVLDAADNKLYAYDYPDGARAAGQDIDLDTSVLTRPRRIAGWDGILWILDEVANTLFAYDIDTKARVSARDIDFSSDVTSARSFHLDGRTIWVLDESDGVAKGFVLASGERDSGTDIDASGEVGSTLAATWYYNDVLYIENFVSSGSSYDVTAYAYSTKSTYGHGSGTTGFDIQLHHTNAKPRGMWSDGTTAWVVDQDNGLFAYDMDSGLRQQSSEFELTLDPTQIAGAWASNTTLYILDRQSLSIMAYDLSTLRRAADDDINLDDANGDPRGLWSDGTYAYVTDASDGKVYGYQLSNGSRVSGEDMDLHTDNGAARGLWGDGTTIWVADANDDHVYAYTQSSEARDSDKDIYLYPDHEDPYAVLGFGNSLWVSGDNVLHGYSLAINADAAARGFAPSGMTAGAMRGVWADNTTMWLIDRTARRLRAYWLETGVARTSRNITLATENADARDITSDGSIIWVLDAADDKMYAYSLTNGDRLRGEEVQLDSGVSATGIHFHRSGRHLFVVDNTDDDDTRLCQVGSA